MRITNSRNATYACKACGLASTIDGGAFVKDAKELKDYFRGGTLGHKTLTEALAGEKLNPATKILLQAKIVEYGVQMWFDGLRQGLVMGAVSSQKLEALAKDAVSGFSADLAGANCDAKPDYIEALEDYLNSPKEQQP